MKVYSLADPKDYRHARAGRRGTWSPGHGVCPECHSSTQTRVPPLIIEWQPDCDVVGDFTWPGFNDEVVVTKRVRDAFQENDFKSLEFLPVEMVQAPSLKRPSRVTKRSKPRVWLPYEGAPLWDLQPSSRIDLDLPRSGIRLKRTCSTCGTQYYEAPPLEERHLVIDKSTWSDQEFFRVRQIPALIFCTQVAVDFVLSRGFTNFGYQLEGEIPH